MSGVKGMVLTGRLVEPPQGSRKVPKFKLWMTEDGTPYGPYGKKATRSESVSGVMTMTVTDEAGRGFHVSVAQMMALAWLPPKLPNSKLVHLDGDQANNAASNLAWVPNLTNSEKRRRWQQKTMSKMEGDPNHPMHGTRTGYQVGCRCQRCRAARKVDDRKRKVRGLIRELGLNPHTGEPLS